MQVNGIVIAGGKSSRMGTNKALVVYQGQRMIDRAIDIIKPLCCDILISTNEFIPNLAYSQIADDFTLIGPIGGLHACLNKSNTALNIVIPCDVPGLSIQLCKQLIARLGDFDAIVPIHSQGKVEPLVAVYRKSILPIIDKQIALKDYKMMHLLQQVNTTYLPIEDAGVFKNMNTPKDLLND